MLLWIEVYKGMDYKQFVRIENLMEENGIPTRTNLKSTRGRMAGNIILGGNPMVLNSSGVNFINQEYQIKVKRKNAEKARFLISKMPLNS